MYQNKSYHHMIFVGMICRDIDMEYFDKYETMVDFVVQTKRFNQNQILLLISFFTLRTPNAASA